MPLSFCFVGLVAMIIWFWGDIRKLSMCLYFLGLVFVQVGYFVTPIELGLVSLNIAILCGAVLCLVGAIVGSQNKNILWVSALSFALAVAYVLTNYFTHDYMLFFSPSYLLFILALCTLFIPNTHEKVLFSVLCYVLCELGCFGFINADFQFYPMFSADTMACMVPLALIIVFECALSTLYSKVKSAKRKSV